MCLLQGSIKERGSSGRHFFSPFPLYVNPLRKTRHASCAVMSFSFFFGHHDENNRRFRCRRLSVAALGRYINISHGCIRSSKHKK